MLTSRRAILLFVCAAQSFACRASTSDGPDEPAPAAAEGAAPADMRAPAVAESSAPGDGDEAAPAPPGPPADGVDELPELHGKTEAEVIARHGEPTSRRSFPMSECCSEFQIELYNTYKPDSGHDDVEIHEWTWAFDGYALTVWFHRQGDDWVALDTCRYSDDVEF